VEAGSMPFQFLTGLFFIVVLFLFDFGFLKSI